MIIVASRENMNGIDGFQIPNNSRLPTTVALYWASLNFNQRQTLRLFMEGLKVTRVKVRIFTLSMCNSTAKNLQPFLSLKFKGGGKRKQCISPVFLANSIQGTTY